MWSMTPGFSVLRACAADDVQDRRAAGVHPRAGKAEVGPGPDVEADGVA